MKCKAKEHRVTIKENEYDKGIVFTFKDFEDFTNFLMSASKGKEYMKADIEITTVTEEVAALDF